MCKHSYNWHTPGTACQVTLCSCGEFTPITGSSGDFLHCWCTHFQMNHRPSTEGGCRKCACESFRLRPEELEKPEPSPHVTLEEVKRRRAARAARRCEGCGHAAHSGFCCRELEMPGPPGSVDECGCLDDREPPLTPEEEEEAGAPCMACPRADAMGSPCPCEEEEMVPGYEELARQRAEGEEACDHQCRCEHDQQDHSSSGHCKQCDCESSTGHYVSECPWGPEEDAPPEDVEICELPHATIEEEEACEQERVADKPPPQPERRPPYLVAYSVQGHLYEVALPGDATVRAVDGALVIQHHLAPVAGIVSVLPIINEESNAQADQ